MWYSVKGEPEISIVENELLYKNPEDFCHTWKKKQKKYWEQKTRDQPEGKKVVEEENKRRGRKK